MKGLTDMNRRVEGTEITRLRLEVEHWASLANKRAIEVHDQRKRAETAEARIKDLEEQRMDLSTALDRANDRVGWVEVPAMNGDNLAVTLCSYFDDGEHDDDDDGWGPSARDGYEQTIQAIRDHYSAALAALRTNKEVA